MLSSPEEFGHRRGERPVAWWGGDPTNSDATTYFHGQRYVEEW